MRLIGMMVIAAVIISACADAPSDTAASDPIEARGVTATMAGNPSSVAICSSIPRLAASPDAYADLPVYVANEMPVEEVQAWASTQPGYEAIWIDRDHNGWITVAFSQDSDARQTELASMFPGVGVVAVGVDWHMADLEALQQRVTDEMSEIADSFGTGVSVTQGVVGIDVGVLTDEIRTQIASRFASERVCVDGRDPSTVPAPGPQPQAGDGWRLLADERGIGEAYRTGIATDARTYAELWAAVGIEATPPEVDFESEVVIWFGAVFGSSCPNIRLDEVVVDGEFVYADIVLPDPPAGCTADANPHAYVVAIERATLPTGPFVIQLDADGPPAGAPEERTVVDADLSVPWAVAAPNAIGPDPNLPEPFVLRSGATIEPDVPYPFTFSTHCGVERLGEFNGVLWHSSGSTPREWRELITDTETLEVELTLRTDPEPVIKVSAGGATVEYVPITQPIPGCD